jgi:flagellar hook-associated protein 2
MALSTNLVSGLASGFDWRSMIDQLIAIERRPVDLVASRIPETSLFSHPV